MAEEEGDGGADIVGEENEACQAEMEGGEWEFILMGVFSPHLDLSVQ
jgi:hypothetical protein